MIRSRITALLAAACALEGCSYDVADVVSTPLDADGPWSDVAAHGGTAYLLDSAGAHIATVRDGAIVDRLVLPTTATILEIDAGGIVWAGSGAIGGFALDGTGAWQSAPITGAHGAAIGAHLTASSAYVIDERGGVVRVARACEGCAPLRIRASDDGCSGHASECIEVSDAAVYFGGPGKKDEGPCDGAIEVVDDDGAPSPDARTFAAAPVGDCAIVGGSLYWGSNDTLLACGMGGEGPCNPGAIAAGHVHRLRTDGATLFAAMDGAAMKEGIYEGTGDGWKLVAAAVGTRSLRFAVDDVAIYWLDAAGALATAAKKKEAK